jgi:hypothetical protein
MSKTRGINNSIPIGFIFLSFIFLLVIGSCSSGVKVQAVNKVLDTPASVQPHNTQASQPPLNIDATRITSETKGIGQGGMSGGR